MNGGGAPSFGPPSGLAQMLMQPAEIAAQDRATGSRNMSQLASMLEQFGEKQKAINDAGKAAQYATSADPSILTESGVHPEEFKNMSAADKANVVQGVQQGRTLKIAGQKMAEGLQQFAEAAQQRKAQDNFATQLSQFTQPNAAAATQLADRAASPVQDPSVTNALTSLAKPQPLGALEHYALQVRSGVDPNTAVENSMKYARIGDFAAQAQQRLQGAPSERTAQAPEIIQRTDSSGKVHDFAFSATTGKFDEVVPAPVKDAKAIPDSGPLKSKDGKFWRNDPTDVWKPVRLDATEQKQNAAADAIAPTLAQLQAMKANGVKKVNLDATGQPTDAAKNWFGGGENIDEAIARLGAIAGSKAAPAAPPPPPAGKPSEADIKYLRANPGKAARFEAQFGKGSADNYLP